MLTFLLLSMTDVSTDELDSINRIMDNKSIVVIIVCILAVYFTAMMLLVWNEQKNKRLWTSTYRRKEKFTDRFFAITYHTLKMFPITRDYIEKLSYHFRLISPCDSKLIARRTVGICLITSSASVMAFLFIFILNPKLITLIIPVVLIIICNNEIVGRNARNFEIKLDQEMQCLIENQIHNYYVNYRVDDALYLSMDSLSPNMRVAADQIYQLLLSDNREQALKEYYENVPNKYLREFVSLCVGVAERGDEEIKGKYLFVKNLENLYLQLEIEIDKLQRLKMEFAGVTTIVILPIFCIDLVKWFCISLKANMQSFYYGKAGFLLDIGLLFITSAIYVIMHKSADYVTFHQSSHRWLYALDKFPLIKRVLNNYCDKYASKMERLKRVLKNNGYNIKPRHYMLRSFLLGITVFIIALGIVGYLNYDSKRSLLIVNIADVASLTSAADEKQYEKMILVIEENTKRYVKNEEGFTETIPGNKAELISILEREKIFYNKLIIDALAIEILQRINKYKAADMSFVDLFASVLIGIATYFIPGIMLKYSASVSKDTMEDEVNQFHALISILMYDKSMTVKQILIEMESYAIVFKSSLRSCINDYSSGDIQAFEALKEDEPYPLFTRIVDNLIRCDDMPIYEAFHEVEVERDGYLTKRKLANEKSIRKRVFRAYILAAAPLILLFTYGIVPILMSAIEEINNTLNSLTGIN